MYVKTDALDAVGIPSDLDSEWILNNVANSIKCFNLDS